MGDGGAESTLVGSGALHADAASVRMCCSLW